MRPGGDALQVVLGPIADQVAGEIRASARAGKWPLQAGKDWVRGAWRRGQLSRTAAAIDAADPAAWRDAAKLDEAR